MPLLLAPENLYQPILPDGRFSLFSVNLGASSDPDMEKKVIQKIGSYGKQIGHLAEALEVVIKHFDLIKEKSISLQDQKKLIDFLVDVEKTKEVKAQA